MTLLELLMSTGIPKSKSEAKRLIESGAVEINGKKYNNPNTEIVVEK